MQLEHYCAELRKRDYPCRQGAAAGGASEEGVFCITFTAEGIQNGLVIPLAALEEEGRRCGIRSEGVLKGLLQPLFGEKTGQVKLLMARFPGSGLDALRAWCGPEAWLPFEAASGTLYWIDTARLYPLSPESEPLFHPLRRFLASGLLTERSWVTLEPAETRPLSFTETFSFRREDEFFSLSLPSLEKRDQSRLLRTLAGMSRVPGDFFPAPEPSSPGVSYDLRLRGGRRSLPLRITIPSSSLDSSVQALMSHGGGRLIVPPRDSAHPDILRLFSVFDPKASFLMPDGHHPLTFPEFGKVLPEAERRLLLQNYLPRVLKGLRLPSLLYWKLSGEAGREITVPEWQLERSSLPPLLRADLNSRFGAAESLGELREANRTVMQRLADSAAASGAPGPISARLLASYRETFCREPLKKRYRALLQRKAWMTELRDTDPRSWQRSLASFNKKKLAWAFLGDPAGSRRLSPFLSARAYRDLRDNLRYWSREYQAGRFDLEKSLEARRRFLELFPEESRRGG